MIECIACLYKDNHPLGILFNEEGLCSGCTLHQEKDILNWDERRESLLNIVKDYRNQSSYDCIVPVTGGQDSYFTVDYVVNEETGEIEEIVKPKVNNGTVVNVQPLPNKAPQSTLTGGVRVSQGGRNKGSAKNLNESFM
jgi:hypothetical protein